MLSESMRGRKPKHPNSDVFTAEKYKTLKDLGWILITLFLKDKRQRNTSKLLLQSQHYLIENEVKTRAHTHAHTHTLQANSPAKHRCKNLQYKACYVYLGTYQNDYP